MNTPLVTQTFVEEKNSVQLAQELNLKAATVRKRISRALSHLRDKCLDSWQGFQSKAKQEYV